MTREEFNNLSVGDQVNYFNEELKNNNFNAICKDLGVSKNTIKPKFIEAGYEPICKGKTNIIITFSIPGQEVKDPKEEVKVNAGFNEVKDPKGNNKSRKKQDGIRSEEMESIIKRLEALEKEVKELKDPKEDQEIKLDKINDEILLSDFSGVTTTRTFKIDIEVNKELDKILNKFSMYKKQDVVSSLLKYALDRIE